LKEQRSEKVTNPDKDYSKNIRLTDIPTANILLRNIEIEIVEQ
jgi:hypothetical protein